MTSIDRKEFNVQRIFNVTETIDGWGNQLDVDVDFWEVRIATSQNIWRDFNKSKERSLHLMQIPNDQK